MPLKSLLLHSHVHKNRCPVGPLLRVGPAVVSPPEDSENNRLLQQVSKYTHLIHYSHA